MRKLLYVPIIHTEADLGSLGPAVERRSASLYGEKRWVEHKETVARFWESIAEYLLSLDAASLKLYQDGLPADGELGRRIVEEAAQRGSINYQILLRLMNKGAELRKTEDASLLAQELRLAQEECAAGNISNYEGTKVSRAGLTEKRDKFIATTIDETLWEGEIAVLFIGAYHNVHLYLPGDIAVKQIKERDRVKAYFQELVSGGGKTFQRLTSYLTSPVASRRRA